MFSRATKIECLDRLFKKTHCQDEFIEYLVDQGILNRDTINPNDREFDVLKVLHTALHEAVQKDKILLLDYKWQLLPIEQIRIQIITSRGSKDWLYGY